MSKWGSVDLATGVVTPRSRPASKGLELLEILNFLEHYKKFQQARRNEALEKEKTATNDKIKKDAGKKEAKKVVQEAPAEFKLTGDMFNTRSNTPALIAVTYLVFSVLSQEEVDERFSNCYPALDGNEQKEYKRVAFKWMEELAKEHLNYFQHAMPQIVIFVNPCGDRCIRTLLAFARCVQSILVRNVQRERNEPYFRKPVFPSKPNLDMFRWQIIILKSAADRNIKKCFDLIVEKAQLDADYEEIQRKKAEIKNTTDKENSVAKDRAQKSIENNPEFFPQNAMSLLSSLKRFSIDEEKDDPDEIFEKLTISRHINDPNIDTLQLNQAQMFGQMSILRQNYGVAAKSFEDYGQFFNLLANINENYKIELDARNYPITFKTKDGTLPQISSVFNSSLASLSDLSKYFPNGLSILNYFPASSIPNFELLRNSALKTIEKTKSLLLYSLPYRREEIEFRTRVALMQLENVDFSYLVPGVKKLDLKKELQFKPVSRRDFSNIETGLSPIITKSMFLSPPQTKEKKSNKLRESLRASEIVLKTGIFEDEEWEKNKNETTFGPFDSYGILEESITQFNFSNISFTDNSFN